MTGLLDPEIAPADRTARSRRTGRTRSLRRLFPVAVALFLTVACFPLGAIVPQYGLDPSWQLALSLVHIRGIPAGPGFVFTYGPLGFLPFPNIVWRPGALLGLGYIATATFLFHYLVCRALDDWLPAIVAGLITALLALVVAQSLSVAEVGTVALFVWSLRLVKPDGLESRLPVWVPTALGGAAALQLLVKFGPGAAALAAGVVVSIARPPRWKNIQWLAGSFLASFVVFWLAAQQSVPDIPKWLWESAQLAAGYSSAMATLPGFQGRRFWLFWLLIIGVLCFRLWRLGAERGARAFPTIGLVAMAAWFFTKEGFIRLEQGHANIAYLGFTALIAAIPWERRRIRIGLVGLAFALSAVIAASGNVDGYPTRIRHLVTEPRHGIARAERVVRSAVDPSFRASQLEASRAALHTAYGLHTVVDGLRDSEVHVDPWEIGAAWAYDLPWRPVPAFQAYSAYTPSLDELNADSLQHRDGPDAVLRANPYLSIGNVPQWESPDYMVALTCGYEITAKTAGWQVLKRRSNACGSARTIGETVARDGEVVRVPAVRTEGDIMVATFDYPTPLVERFRTMLIKPSRMPKVLIDGTASGFLAATDAQLHLVHVPATIGTREITNGGLDIRTLAFPNAEGAVTVRFYEMSTGQPR